MSGAHIKRRLGTPDKKTGKQTPRYLVYYREGSKFKERYAGSFPTKAEARIRRDLVGGELAAGRDPAILLAALKTPPPPPAGLLERWDEFRASRIDVSRSASLLYRNSRDRWVPILGEDTAPEAITPRDIIDGIGELVEDLKPSTIKHYVSSLAQVLDFCDVEPNPVRSRKVRLPKGNASTIEIPTTRAWFAIRDHAKKRSRLALRLIECDGLRVSECADLAWGDVDFGDRRILIQNTKTAAGRRWLPVPADLLDEIDDLLEREERPATMLVFGLSSQAIRYDLERACLAAGSGAYSPHELRHRRCSLWYRHGIDPITVRGWAGHTKASMGLDTYGHVVIDDPQDDEWMGFWKTEAAYSRAAHSRHGEAE